MNTIPAPSLVLHQEEWPDADFDLPEGEPILRTLNSRTDIDDADEDWDLEMDFGKTAGAKAQAVVAGMVARQSTSKPQLFTIRPPLPSTADADFDDDDDEGISTIKVSQLPQPLARAAPPTPIDEDLECDFSLPPDLTQLSLAPHSLTHRSSKTSLEWGDKDHTSSSQSSDAYSSLGFADNSPSSNSASSISQPETENEETEDDEDLEGLVIPSGMFDAKQSTRKLTQILELKKKVVIGEPQVKIASPDPEDDFEMGLLIEDDVDLSPSRLLYAAQQKPARRFMSRSNTAPTASRLPTSSLRPPSRLRAERAKSPISRPPSASTRQLQKIRLSPSPPPSGLSRAGRYQPLASPPTSPPTSFLTPKSASLRGQKSHSGLKPPSPPQSARKLTRKASLSSLMDSGSTKASGFELVPPVPSTSKARYEEPTAASRARHKNTTSRIHDFKVPPTRPSTPSSNPAALRLTMPTQSRLKLRPALSTVFGSSSVNSPQSPLPRSASPLPPRPPSAASTKASKPSGIPQPIAAPKVLRRPKRQRTYGDGTELDAINDLPADREKEARYRVQPKGFGNRIPGGTFTKSAEKGTVRKKGKREAVECTAAFAPPTQTLKRAGRIDFAPKTSTDAPAPKTKLKKPSSPVTPGHTRRKPTLIRNLGGVGGPKVVGEMKWNPQSLRWEGNDQVLRDFDVAVGTSSRPALITHLTGSSIGSPVASFASGARIVGNMMFDPTRMCWISTLPPEEDEPDVFANLADDEDDDDWDSKGGTIRANLQGKALVPSDTSGTSHSSNPISEAPSPAHSRCRAMSDSGSDRGSRASMVYDVDDDFLEACRLAEERHRAEMKGWRGIPSKSPGRSTEPDRSYLYDIRALATCKY
ncbi:hypothetical protein HGRIS_008065 [Hohenbuehelia grisea]|uniref:Protein byr4 n=1 Tax=Hohenbuehelia grisea TaxID=104357 RepID=A0ABR3J6T3_9AGAR